MFNFIKRFILSIFLTIFCFSIETCLFINEFNYNRVISTIKYLSSNKFQGRLPGTIENKQVSQFIKNYYKQNNILPYNKDSYFHTFYCTCPSKISNKPYLRISDNKDNVIKEFTYGKDFKEDMLNFRSNIFCCSKMDDIKQTNNFININNAEGSFIIMAPEDNNINFRSSFIKNSLHDMYIMVTKDTLKELKFFLNEGDRITCFIPYELKQTNLNNVVGYIKGKSSNNPLVITCHYDHVGSDFNNTVYSGALDNASGTSFMLEIIKNIKSLGTPNQDIVFVSFNAEEFGCLGSKYFVQDFYNKLKNGTVLNFDMIGGSNKVPLCIMGGSKDSPKNSLINSIAKTCSSTNINFNYIFEDASDHCSFRQKNINAITFCDNDTSKIHTPLDTVNNIELSSIKRCYKVAFSEIIKYGFNQNLYLIYYKPFLIISIMTLCILIFIFKIHNK